jgi:hypothetical protein
MNEHELERYRTAWKGGQEFGRQPLGQDAIDAVLNKESKNITRQFRVGLLTDMALKGAAAVALVGLLFLYSGQPTVNWLNAFVLAFTLFLLFVQWKTLRRIPGHGLAGDSLRRCLHQTIRFYRKRFVRALYVGAVSGSLVFYVGVFYYSWFRYGGIRPLDADDYAVFIGGLLIAYAFNAVAQRWQMNFHVRELEFCLQEIDAESLTEQDLRKKRHRRVRVSLMWLVWAVLGVLVLAWFLAR